MKIKLQIVMESEDGSEQVIQEVTEIERGSLQPENLGLSLTEAKTLLQQVQQTLVEQQVAEYEQQQDSCQHCGGKLLHKDKRTIVYRTLFGKLTLPCNRLFHCNCQPQPTRTFQPLANLLTERTSPELLYVESKFASLMSYGLSVKLLEELLPLEGQINATTVRNNVQAIAQRLENELGEEKDIYIEGVQRDWDQLPRPDLPLVVGMDGGYVRYYDSESKQKGNFEVIVGKSTKADGTSLRFGFAYGYLDDIFVLADDEKKPCPVASKLYKMMEEFETYIRNNEAMIPNYGERWRYGESISSSFVESTVNQVISKRFVKKQQMRWTPKGAHLLLQIRIQVLNRELRRKFQQWYSGLTPFPEENIPLLNAA